MKKFLILCLFYLGIVSTVVAEETLTSQKEATTIYNMCNNEARNNKSDTILQDIENEQAVQQCLKKEIIKIVSSYIDKTQISNFEESLNSMEKVVYETYRILIFCNKDGDNSWCTEWYKNDTSLGKLLLEKNITSQIYQILIKVIDGKQGGFLF